MKTFFFRGTTLHRSSSETMAVEDVARELLSRYTDSLVLSEKPENRTREFVESTKLKCESETSELTKKLCEFFK